MPAKQRVRNLQAVHLGLGTGVSSFKENQFRQAVWHLEQILSRRLVEVGGCPLGRTQSLQIFFGPIVARSGYQPSANGWASIDTPKFDLDKFLRLTDVERDRLALQRIEKALVDVARQETADLEPLRSLLRWVREQNGERYYPEPTKSARHLSRAIDGLVCQHIGRGTKLRYCVRLVDGTGKVIATEWVPESVSMTNPFFNYFAKSSWKGDEFRFCRSSGQVIYAIDVGPVLHSLHELPAETEPSSAPPTKSRLSEKRVVRKKAKIESVKVRPSSQKAKHPSPKRNMTVYRCEAEPEVSFSADELKTQAIRFFELLLVGNSKDAYGMLAKSQRRSMTLAKFRRRVVDYEGFADPNQNAGVTLETVRPYISATIEDADITRDMEIELPASIPRDAIVACLHVGGEAISREELSVVLLYEKSSLRIVLR